MNDGARRDWSSSLKRLLRAVLFTLLACGVRPAAGQEAGAAVRFRESVAIDTDLTAQRQLELARVHLAEKRWNEGIDLIRQAAANAPGSLVAISAGRYLNVDLYAQLLLGSLPPEGLAVARKAIDESARQAFEEAVRNRDEAALRAVVRGSFVSRAAHDALMTLGQWAWELGDVTKARGNWERLIPLRNPPPPGTAAPILRYPDTRFDRAEILARLVMCSIVEGDQERSAAERTAFRRLYPEAHGSLAGRTGKLADLLDEIAAGARRWSYPPRDLAVTTFGVNAARNGVLPAEIDVGAMRWAVDLPPDAFAPVSTGPAANGRDALSLFPVVYGDLLVLNTADQILAWNLRTGKPAWPVDHNSKENVQSAVIYPSGTEAIANLATAPPAGTPRYTSTISDGRLYARLGDPITTRPRDDPRESDSFLVCLDLQRGEGKLLWKVDAGVIDAQSAFEGSPLVVDGRAYAAVRRGRPQMLTGVACFDAETGRRLWERPVCAAVANVGQGDGLLSHHLLTAGDNAVFLSTGMGAVAALEADGGALRWIVTYESNLPEGSSPGSGRSGNWPCLYAENAVFAAPNDFDGILAIESHSGTTSWRRALPGGIEHLLGAKNGVLIASGQGLWGLALSSGRVLWHVGYKDPVSFGYGLGILAGDVVYWPTREEILVVEQATGTLRRRIPLLARNGEGGGNIVLASEFLVVAQPQRITVFGPDAGLPPHRKNVVKVEGTRIRDQFDGLQMTVEWRHESPPRLVPLATRRSVPSLRQ
ncbi:MAG TPA: PQQ-binding-like beta-propeller repeat protein [Planctomycetaceae bacterium]|nr:PQQ-binding-like beta-propeller repeat protein [Planctomycetaceae bacterium]